MINDANSCLIYKNVQDFERRFTPSKTSSECHFRAR